MYQSQWSVVETREREFQAGISLNIGRKRNSQINRSSQANTANRSSENVEDRAHETE